MIGDVLLDKSYILMYFKPDCSCFKACSPFILFCYNKSIIYIFYKTYRNVMGTLEKLMLEFLARTQFLPHVFISYVKNLWTQRRETLNWQGKFARATSHSMFSIPWRYNCTPKNTKCECNRKCASSQVQWSKALSDWILAVANHIKQP